MVVRKDMVGGDRHTWLEGAVGAERRTCIVEGGKREDTLDELAFASAYAYKVVVDGNNSLRSLLGVHHMVGRKDTDSSCLNVDAPDGCSSENFRQIGVPITAKNQKCSGFFRYVYSSPFSPMFVNE